jgi:HlyD family secretion protein
LSEKQTSVDETSPGAASLLPLAESGKAAGRASAKRAGPGLLVTVAIAIALLLLGGVIGLYFQGPAMRAIFAWMAIEPGAGARRPIALPVERIPSAERVAALEVGDVLALGRIRPRDGIVTVGLPAGTGDARIEKLTVAQGDVVAEGALLAILDTRLQYESALDNAETNLAIRRASLDKIRAQTAAAEAETRALLQSAETNRASADADLSRARQLQTSGATTQARLDDAQSKADMTRAEAARLAATLSRYTPDTNGLQVDIALAESELAAAKAAFERAQRDLARARVHAPRAGTIIALSVREGERPPPDGLLRLGDTERMEVELEVFQTMISRIAIGQAVSIRSSVLGETALEGKVMRIGTLVGRQKVTADDPAANTDARVLEVIVALDGASNARAARLVGLEVIGHIHVSGRTGNGPSAR